uniref:Uncharacterized protein n=1 Tax=Siphoviridae sp. ctB3v5 TaxID=2826186 RepID=A0A8S5M8V2_9CAUD|nr:MAG TPA: hypothetical protein [Siphoviridae sp. ctB3v5]
MFHKILANHLPRPQILLPQYHLHTNNNLLFLFLLEAILLK